MLIKPVYLHGEDLPLPNTLWDGHLKLSTAAHTSNVDTFTSNTYVRASKEIEMDITLGLGS
jgi:hypothetical protein